nr:hypothetical protein [Flavobacterium sp.]
MKNFILITILFSSSFVCSSQTKENRFFLGKKFAEKELEFALSKQNQNNVLDDDESLLKDSNTAIKIAELILFNIYGKVNILDEKPYEIYLIKNYWVIQGTLPKKSKGGTFLIILNAKNAEV